MEITVKKKKKRKKETIGQKQYCNKFKKRKKDRKKQ